MLRLQPARDLSLHDFDLEMLASLGNNQQSECLGELDLETSFDEDESINDTMNMPDMVGYNCLRI